jgi:hypothetical protein
VLKSAAPQRNLHEGFTVTFSYNFHAAYNGLCSVIDLSMPLFFSLMDSVIVSKVLEDVSAISVRIIFGEIQMKNAMVSHKYCFIGGCTFFVFIGISFQVQYILHIPTFNNCQIFGFLLNDSIV